MGRRPSSRRSKGAATGVVDNKTAAAPTASCGSAAKGAVKAAGSRSGGGALPTATHPASIATSKSSSTTATTIPKTKCIFANVDKPTISKTMPTAHSSRTFAKFTSSSCLSSAATNTPLASMFHFAAGSLISTLTIRSNSSSSQSVGQKRGRALADVDGEHSFSYKKKRRIRLQLITSRLSPVFSQPATYIVDRGSSKIAVWAKQRALGRNLLRKAAVLNYAKHREQEQRAQHQQRQQQQILGLQQRQLEMARQAFLYGAVDTKTHPVVCAPRVQSSDQMQQSPLRTSTSSNASTTPRNSSPNLSYASSPNFTADDSSSPNFSYQLPPIPPRIVRGPYLDHPASSSVVTDEPGSSRKHDQPTAQIPRRDFLPLPPSPLGLSNYDAFDLEDDYFPMDEEDEDDDDGSSTAALSFAGDDDDDSNSYFSSAFGAHYAPSWRKTRALSTASAISAAPSSPPTVYSDFNVLEPMEAVCDDHDQIEAFAGTSTTAGVGALEDLRREAERRHEIERKKAAERLNEIRQENERQREVFAGLRKFMG